MSTGLARYLRNMRAMGLKDWVRAMWYIGDAKHGRFVGQDSFGNKYYENLNPEEETPGRQRWIDFTEHDFNASHIPPEWHAWIHHIRKDPPMDDATLKRVVPKWQTQWRENLTGTRGAYKPYSTTKAKFEAWEPKITARGS